MAKKRFYTQSFLMSFKKSTQHCYSLSRKNISYKRITVFRTRHFRGTRGVSGIGRSARYCGLSGRSRGARGGCRDVLKVHLPPPI